MHAHLSRPTALWALSVLLALMLGGWLIAAGVADAAEVALAANFSPYSHLGEGASLQANLSIAGNEYFGHADPLSSLTLHLPAGTSVTSDGFVTCSQEIIEQREILRCPEGSLAGPLGSFTAWIAFGAHLVLEQGEVQAVFGPGGTLYFVAEGRYPASVEYIMEGHIAPASPPNGPVLELSVPLVETVPGAPYMSLSALDLGLGVTRTEPDGSEVASVTAPSTCAVSLAWSAIASFSGTASEPVAESSQGCLPSGQRARSITTIAVTNKTIDALEEAITYTATVQPVSTGTAPTGTVTFFDGTGRIAGCENQPLVERSGTATVSCQASYVTYTGLPVHHLTASYSGDETYRGSISQPSTVTIGEGEATKEVTHETPTAKEASTGGSGSPAGRGSAGPGGGTPSTAVSSAQLKALLAHRLIPSGKAATITALLRSGGYTMTFTAPEAGTLTVQWYELPPGAKLAKHHKSKPVLVASGKLTFSAAGVGQVRLRLTAQGRRLLRHGKRVKLEVKGTFAPASGMAIAATTSSRLRL